MFVQYQELHGDNAPRYNANKISFNANIAKCGCTPNCEEMSHKFESSLARHELFDKKSAPMA